MVPALRSGELATRPLPGLLLDLHDGGVNGCLTLRRAGVSKSIELANGELVRVVSTLRDETLGHFLVARGVIDEQQHRRALDRAAAEQVRLGEALVQLGVLSGDALHRQLIEQDRHKLVAALRWPQGTWRFDVTRAPTPALAGLWLPEVVLRGLHATGDRDLERLRRLDGMTLELTARGRALSTLLRDVFGAQVAAALERGGSVPVLERSCSDCYAVRSAADALLLCGGALVHRVSGGASVEVTTSAMSQGEPTLPRGVAPRRSDPALGAALTTAAAPSSRRASGPIPSIVRGGVGEGVGPVNARRVPPVPSAARAWPAAAVVPAVASTAPGAAGPAVSAAGAASAAGPAPPAAPSSRAPATSAPDVVPPVSSRVATRREGWPSEPGAERVVAVPRTITSAARSHGWTQWSALAARTETHPLYELLFDEPQTFATEGAAPLQFSEAESGVVSSAELSAVNEHSELAQAARQALVAEAERVRNADLYHVLLVERSADPAQLTAALAERHRQFSRERYAALALGPDRPRLEEVLAIYETARSILLDEQAREGYDRALVESEQRAPTLDAEVAFADAAELVRQHRYQEAVSALEGLTARAPAHAEFHAALGWAHWLHQGPSRRAGELAAPHLRRAIELDPDHVEAHVHRAEIGAALGDDDAEVLFHLERALELRPSRVEALTLLERVLLRRGELRRLERVYKRLLFRLSTTSSRRAAELWLCLAELYAHHLDELPAAEVAAQNAETLGGANEELRAQVARLRTFCARPQHPLEPARARLRKTRDVAAAAELIQSAGETGQLDSALVTAATMVALGTADAQMRATYERHRVQRPSLPERPFTEEHWALLRDPDDAAEVGALMGHLAPAAATLAPITLAEAQVDVTMQVAEAELPAPFLRVRAQLARILGVEPCPVYARPELERQVQAVATWPPVLLAGDEALTAPERPELVCRLARAMCLARPGYAIGGSRSGAVLRALLLAVVRLATTSDVGRRDPLAAAATAAVAALPTEVQEAARAEALRLLSRAGAVNLSQWSRAVVHTADRVGLLLCQDIPTALTIARERGQVSQALTEFAFGAEHVALRAALELAISR